MQTYIPVPPNDVFTSWKEIAAYLNKGVRTVQRWENEFGLPVRRPRDRARGIVQASRQDLDRWMQSTWASRAQRASQASEKEMAQHHLLRSRNRQLVQELRKSLSSLIAECAALRSQCETSRLQWQPLHGNSGNW